MRDGGQAGFLLFAFYISQSMDIPPRYNHIVSVSLPAAALYFQGASILG